MSHKDKLAGCMMPRIFSGLGRAFPLLIISLLFSCATPRQYPAGFVLKGTMHFADIEGGCWVFKSDDGQVYQLIGKDTKRLGKDGLRAEILVAPRTDLASVCMVGRTVEVVEILKIYP